MSGIHVFCSVVLVLAGAAQTPPPTVEDIEARALAARTGIRTLSAKLTVSGWEELGGRVERWSSERTIWQRGSQIRVDYVLPEGQFANIRRTQCKNCEKMGWGLTAIHTSTVTTEVFRLAAPKSPHLAQCFDYRVLGYYSQALSQCDVGIDAVVGRADRTAPVMTKEQYAGEECWRLNWTAKNGVRFGVWIAPGRGYNVVRIDTYSRHKGEPDSRQSLRSEVVKVGAGWFPARTTYTVHTGEKEVIGETIDFRDVELNDDIPAGTFTFAGMNPVPGATIILPNKSDVGVWDEGTRTIRPFADAAPDTVDTTPRPLAPAPDRRSTGIVVAASCLGAAVALIVGRRVLRSRTAKG